MDEINFPASFGTEEMVIERVNLPIEVLVPENDHCQNDHCPGAICTP